MNDLFQQRTLVLCLKCQDLLSTLQNEIVESVKDLTKAKKKYYDCEQVAENATEKWQDVTER